MNWYGDGVWVAHRPLAFDNTAGGIIPPNGGGEMNSKGAGVCVDKGCNCLYMKLCDLILLSMILQLE